MSRLRLFIYGVASSYILLGANVVYSLVSVPLALSFLTTKQFGIWALLTQIVSYMWLIDLGMSPSFGRLLIERKDQRDEGTTYGSLIQTGFWVAAIQGVLVFLAVFLLAPFLADLFRIPPTFSAVFCHLVRWQAAISGVVFGTRMFRNILYAHQRNDLINYTLAVSLVFSLAALWIALQFGAGVQSVLWANASAMAVATLMFCWFCARLRLLPAAGAWGQSSWREFKEVFAYGKDVFLVQIGSFLIVTTQPIIVSRSLGLEAVAAWSIGTKAFFLLSSLIYQTLDVSAPAFSEMMVRGETEQLRRRFVGVVVILMTVSGIAAVCYAACNSLFVSVWTHGRISWPAGNDVLLGAWMIVSVLIYANSGFIILTKRIVAMRYAFIIEGTVFIVLASLVTTRGGIPAMVGCSLLCRLFFSGAYSVARIRGYFQFRKFELEQQWLLPLLRVLLWVLPAGLAVFWATVSLGNLFRLLICVTVVGGTAVFSFCRCGMPAELRLELIQRAPPWLGRLLQKTS